MSQYTRTLAQTAYLKRMYAQRARDASGCECPGCDTCKGFVKGCICDLEQGLADLREVRNNNGKPRN